MKNPSFWIGAMLITGIVGLVIVPSTYADQAQSVAVDAVRPPLFASDSGLSEAIRYRPEKIAGHAPSDPLLLLPVKVGGWWGYADRRGSLIVAPTYEWVDHFEPFTEYRRRREMKSWRTRVVANGRTSILCYAINKEDRDNSVNDLYTLQTHVPSSSGSVDWAGRFSDDHALVANRVGQDVRVWAIRDNGELVWETGRDTVGEISDHRVALKRSGHFFYLDLRADIEFTAPVFTQAGPFREGVAIVRNAQGQTAVIDVRGEVVFLDARNEIESLREFRDGLAPVKAGGKWGYLDKRFRIAIPPRFESAEPFFGGVAVVKENGQWGLLNKAGRIVPLPGYDRVTWGGDTATLSDDAASRREYAKNPRWIVWRDGKAGYIDRRGKEVVPVQFTDAHPYHRGAARVACPPSFGYIDVGGRVLWDPLWVEQTGVRGLELRPTPPAQAWTGVAEPGGDRPPAPYPLFEPEGRVVSIDALGSEPWHVPDQD